MKLGFYRLIFEKYLNFTEICPVGAELLHAVGRRDGRTDMTKLTVAIHNIANAEMKYTRTAAGYTWTDYKTNTQITKEFKITPILDKLLEYKRNWIHHVNRMPRSRLPRVMKHYSPTGRRNRGRPLKRLLDTWDRNGSTSGLTPWKIDDDDDEYCKRVNKKK